MDDFTKKFLLIAGVAKLLDNEKKLAQQKKQQQEYEERIDRHEEKIYNSEMEISRYQEEISRYQEKLDRSEDMEEYQSLEDMLESNRRWRESYVPEPIKISIKEKIKELKRNILVVQIFWQKVHLDFKHCLTLKRGKVKLKYEIINNSGVPWKEKDCGITVKIRVADAKNRTIWEKKDYITDAMLASGKVKKTVCLSDCNVELASNIWITAQGGDWTLEGK